MDEQDLEVEEDGKKAGCSWETKGAVLPWKDALGTDSNLNASFAQCQEAVFGALFCGLILKRNWRLQR